MVGGCSLVADRGPPDRRLGRRQQRRGGRRAVRAYAAAAVVRDSSGSPDGRAHVALHAWRYVCVHALFW